MLCEKHMEILCTILEILFKCEIMTNKAFKIFENIGSETMALVQGLMCTSIYTSIHTYIHSEWEVTLLGD